ncbi:MAG: HEAT repeat domain-containing protein [Planctomycetaceae bacterium]|nr:HEAT repeat domain-containing protein [Planctomycetaceae bacterium]
MTAVSWFFPDELISDRVLAAALTALLQSVLVVASAWILVGVLRRRHVLCHAVCLGAMLSCLVCPILTYSWVSRYSTSLWGLPSPSPHDDGATTQQATVSHPGRDDLEVMTNPETDSSRVLPESVPPSAEMREAVATETSTSALASNPVQVRQNAGNRIADASAGSSGSFVTGNLQLSRESDRRTSTAPEAPAVTGRISSNAIFLRTALCWFVVVWSLLVIGLSVRLLVRFFRLSRLLSKTTRLDEAQHVVDEATSPASSSTVVDSTRLVASSTTGKHIADVWQLAQDVAAASGLRRLPEILVSSRIMVPFVYGIRSPRMVIPEFLIGSEYREQLRDVLAHEMCHLAHGDLWKSVIQRLVQLVYCVNPLVHVIASRMSRVREEICDNHVLQFTTPTDYCRTLLSLAERISLNASSQPLPALPLSILGGRWSLESRVAGLLLPSRRRETTLHRRSAAAVATAFGLVMVVVSRMTVGGSTMADDSQVSSVKAQTSANSSAANSGDIEPKTEAEAVLQQVLEKAKRWTGRRKESLKSLAYDYELAGRKQSVELVSGMSQVRRSQWEGATVTGGIHWLAFKPDAFDVSMESVDSEDDAASGGVKGFYRFTCQRRSDAAPMSISFGNGNEGTWSGYFSQGFQTIVLEVDRDTLLPIRERTEATLVLYDDWKPADDSYQVPGLISVRRLDTQWDMQFDWWNDTVWLLTEAEIGTGDQKQVIARTSNVRVNNEAVVRKFTERERQRQQATEPLRTLYEHNQRWLNRQLSGSESLSYTFHTEREDVKEACYVNQNGIVVFEVIHDGKDKHQGTGRRTIALSNGNWVTGNRAQKYLYPHQHQPERNRPSEPFGNQIRNYALLGGQFDLPLFRLKKILDNIQPTTTSGEWNGIDCDVVQIAGAGRSAWLGCGTMLAFTSWSYVHHIYPSSTTLHIDTTRHVPLHESIVTGRDHDFEIDYLKWKEVEPGQWVPMEIRVESKDYFTCEMQFQLAHDRHWMLKEVTSWFDPADKSRGVVSDVQIDQPSEYWNHAKVQLDATLTLFPPADADAAGTPPTSDAASAAKTTGTVPTTPLEFGKWVNVDGVQAMVTMASIYRMELKIRSVQKPATESLAVVIFNQAGYAVSSGTVTLEQTDDGWIGSMKVSAMRAEETSSIAIAGQQGPNRQTLTTTPVEFGKTQIVNITDHESGKTRAAEIELSKNEDDHTNLRLKIVSINGPQEFPVTTNVLLFDEQKQLVASGEVTQSIRVDGQPYVGDLVLDFGVVPQSSQLHAAAVSLRNGRATRAPMGSTWGMFVGFPEVTVPTETLLAADDPKCREVAVQRLNNKLADKIIEKELFGDERDRKRAIERKQTRRDLLLPYVDGLVQVIQSEAPATMRRDAVRLLGHSGDRTQVPVLLPLLESSEETIRDAAAVALAMLGNDAGFARLEFILNTASAAIDDFHQTAQRSDPDWQQKRNVWISQSQTEQDVLIALVALKSEPATEVLGRTLTSDLKSLTVATDEKGQPYLEGRGARLSKIIALSREASADIVPWLASAVDFLNQHAEIAAVREKSWWNRDVSLADALLAHEDAAQDVIAQQIRRLDLSFVYAIKEGRNPWYIPAVREMLFNPAVESWTWQKGVEYLWNVGTPEAVALLKQLYDHKGPEDYQARMMLCQALVHFQDDRGLQEALRVMAESFEDSVPPTDAGEAKAQKKLTDRKRQQSQYVFRKASDEMITAVALSHADASDTGTQRAILSVLRTANLLPESLIATIKRWAASDHEKLRTEARDLLNRENRLQ